MFAAQGLGCCLGSSVAAAHGGCSLAAAGGCLTAEASSVVGHRLQGVWDSVVVAHRLQSIGSIAVVHGFSCSVACGILPDQGLNPCFLPWQADSSPQSPQGSPVTLTFMVPLGQ